MLSLSDKVDPKGRIKQQSGNKLAGFNSFQYQLRECVLQAEAGEDIALKGSLCCLADAYVSWLNAAYNGKRQAMQLYQV